MPRQGRRQIDERPATETLDAVRGVLKEYEAVLGIPLCLDIPRGRIARAHSGRGLWLHPMVIPGRLWPLVTPPVQPMTLPAVCGLPLAEGCQDGYDIEQYGHWGQPLWDAEGQLIGLLRRSSLYLFFDLLAQEPLLARLLTRAVLDLALRAAPPPAGLAEADLARALTLQQATEEESARLGQRLVLRDQPLVELERRLGPADGLTGQFDRLAGIPGIARVRIGDQAVHLFTDLVTVEHGGRRFRLGRFRMDLHFDGRLVLRNLTDRYGRYDHPHVEDGRPCLGNIRNWVQELLSQHEFLSAAIILLAYLHTVNESDWRVSLTYWPKVRVQPGDYGNPGNGSVPWFDREEAL